MSFYIEAKKKVKLQLLFDAFIMNSSFFIPKSIVVIRIIVIFHLIDKKKIKQFLF